MKDCKVLVKGLNDKKNIFYFCGRCPHLQTFPLESLTKNFKFCERNDIENFTFCERNYNKK